MPTATATPARPKRVTAITAQHIDHVSLWVKEHSPKNAIGRPPVMLAASPTAGVSPPAVTSGAVAVGAQLTQSLALDSAVGSALPAAGTVLTPDQYAKLLATFTNSPATGCTTVMDMARIAASYNPLAPNDTADEKATNRAAYNDYVARVMRAPFFTLNNSDSSTYHRQESNWDTAVDAIVALYDGVEAEDKDKIKTSLANLAKAAGSNSNTSNTDNLFVQSTLNLDAEIIVYIYSSVISMMESKSKGSDSKQTDIVIQRTQLTFYKNLWPSYAQMVMNHHVKLVADWLNDNSAPVGPKAMKLCIKGS